MRRDTNKIQEAISRFHDDAKFIQGDIELNERAGAASVNKFTAGYKEFKRSVVQAFPWKLRWIPYILMGVASVFLTIRRYFRLLIFGK